MQAAATEPGSPVSTFDRSPSSEPQSCGSLARCLGQPHICNWSLFNSFVTPLSLSLSQHLKHTQKKLPIATPNERVLLLDIKLRTVIVHEEDNRFHTRITEMKGPVRYKNNDTQGDNFTTPVYMWSLIPVWCLIQWMI